MQIGPPGAPVSRIAQAYPDRVEVRGRDLTGDLMGRLGFTEYFHLLLTGSEPTDEQRFFLDVLLVSIAEHGMMPTNVAARMTLAADPDSLQGAVAAGILGCGTVVLARCLRESVAEAWGKPLTMNVSVPMAAVMLDLGFPSSTVKAVPILARTAGLLAHLAEEQQQPIGFLMAGHAEEAIAYEPPGDATP